MARRYYQSRRDRMDESRGMKMEESRGVGPRFREADVYDKQPGGNEYIERSAPDEFNKMPQRYNDKDRRDLDPSQDGFFREPGEAEYYMGMPSDMRRGLEKNQMIGEDHRAIANLPQEVMIKTYPHVGPYLPEHIEDSIVGVDAQMEYDDMQRARHNYPKKH